MSGLTKKILLAVLLGVVLVLFWYIFIPKQDTSHYYSILSNQEDVLSATVLTETQKQELFECTKSLRGKKVDSEDNCVRSFYQEYTIKHGVQEAFSHLSLVQKLYPTMLPDCHYIAHGIGHGAVEINHGSAYKAFIIMDNSNFFKNLITCGNGYYHGVVEEVSEGLESKEDIARVLKPVCTSVATTTIAYGNCYHGIGHAAAVDLKGEMRDALYVCDTVSGDPNNRFSCYTGVFMEVGTDASVDVKKGVARFVECDQYERPYRQACYLEQTSLMEHFSREPRNYTRNMGFCKQIISDIDRMACIKLFTIRAVRISRYEDVKSVCLNTSTRLEKEMCAAVFAYRIGASIDKTKSEGVYRSTINDVCGLFDPLTNLRCRYNVAKGSLFTVSERDLKEVPNGELLDFYKEKIVINIKALLGR